MWVYAYFMHTLGLIGKQANKISNKGLEERDKHASRETKTGRRAAEKHTEAH